MSHNDDDDNDDIDDGDKKHDDDNNDNASHIWNSLSSSFPCDVLTGRCLTIILLCFAHSLYRT